MSDGSTIRFRDRTGGQATTRYLRRGAGPAVVLVHGVGMQASVWEAQIAALARHYDVVALDMLGHGGSSLPPADAGLADYADQVLALMDGLGLRKAHLVGHSMGALVALEFALSHPSRLASVIAVNAVFCRSEAQRRSIEERLAALEGEAGLPSWAGTIARWFGEPVPPEWSAAAATVRALLDGVDPVGYERTYRLFATADAAHRDRLAGLAAPALFMTGAGDPNSSPAMSEAMARLAPHGRAEIVPHERHMMTLTAPGEINRRLLAFLGEAGAKGQAKDGIETAPAAGFDRLAFRKALGTFLTGVTVVATLQEDGEPRGFTANSFTSVSLDPPLVLICIAKTASSYPVFSAAGHFAVSILAETQADVSSLFATRNADKFARAAWRKGITGSPILADVAAWFDCRRHDVVEAGDHIILIGEVLGFDQAPANPLGYCRGAHVTFGLALDKVAASGGRTRVGAILEHDSAILFVADDAGRLDLPSGAALGSGTDPASLTGRMRTLGIKAELGFLFAVFEDPQAGPGAMSIVYRGTLLEPPVEAGAVRLIGFDAIPWERLRDEATRSMLRRYVRERREDVFGVYVGDAERGTVQTLARSA
ncbi:alpha/beta fold hydrolase [Labrys wisconsinensis]|uniref:Flavin reductase (DIM6/NTAB) family NADH-FMN oxidoreductase RutF/pimeloyl-ACP methyl ester carboxylesterase n=1 Tax=Labrys wisconsinensis TaxID=425677 RepID=A0ABU0JM41_9HYPH|nr:alpha/beta fold hydrolase [Labrys wisconsinensis]MDQ0475360.1 flavin reductase (DIM6/NTAB) family NADH-FMN oxidoreductase RutF/pimeloyl-ACP methyl ester carboxylesterase [Labrys wisconsinensis]